VIAAEDLEAGTRKLKYQAEPTLPIYLKVTTLLRLLAMYMYAASPFPLLLLLLYTLLLHVPVFKPVFVNMHACMD
jgi:hypothetical protein